MEKVGVLEDDGGDGGDVIKTEVEDVEEVDGPITGTTNAAVRP